MTRETKTTLVLLLAVPLLLGAVASNQRGIKNEVAPHPDAPKATAAAQSEPTSPVSNTEGVGVPTAHPTSSAATYSLDWYSINGGGTIDASSTNYKLGASVGQSVAGAASSPSYQLGIGFWYGAGGGCSCPCKYDPQCDGVISDILDVTLTINRAFRGAASVQDPSCPVERTDVNASSATDVIDVTKVINVAFRGMSVASQYIDPCAP
jgi:hypothetical protein